ncbi:MAG: lipid-A-disaccharide synthase, partial [Candidatus Eiseniibacteriota bacterium]
MSPPGRIVLVAGEPSGDRHGARLANELRAQPALREMELVGVAGPAMRAAGVTALVAMEDVAVVGVVEVLRHLKPLLDARKRIRGAIEDSATRLFLPIDFPGFNLPLARVAHARGVPVLYYIAPQVWAWGRGRLEALRRDVDALAVVLPFEEAFFREAGVPVRAVGHPLMESLDPGLSRAAFLEDLAWPADAQWVALLPGSRDQEIERLAGPLLGAARKLLEARPQA